MFWKKCQYSLHYNRYVDIEVFCVFSILWLYIYVWCSLQILWRSKDFSGGMEKNPVFKLSSAPQVSIVVDGGKKAVEFSSQGLIKNTLRYTFKSRDLHALFDRQWHKLSISVQSNIVSIYMDCKLIERRLTDEKDSIDPSGRTLITTRVEDGRPVDVCHRQTFFFFVLSYICFSSFIACLQYQSKGFSEILRNAFQNTLQGCIFKSV